METGYDFEKSSLFILVKHTVIYLELKCLILILYVAATVENSVGWCEVFFI